MQNVTSEFLDALSGSAIPVVTVDVWTGGRVVHRGVAPIGGQVSLRAGQSIEGSASVLLADPENLLRVNDPTGGISTLGSELHIQAGVRLPTGTELVSLGWYPVTALSGEGQTWRHYDRPDEPGRTYSVASGQMITIEARDRCQLIRERRFLTRTQPAKKTAQAEIARLLQGIVPWAGSALPDKSIPASVTYEDDRLKACQDLAELTNADLVMLPTGQAGLRSRNMGRPIWSVGATPTISDGLAVSMQISANRDELYNCVVATGVGPDQGVLRHMESITTGPLSINGPLGPVPFFYHSPLLSTQQSVEAAARTRLASITSRLTQEVSISAVSNPALQLGDVISVPRPWGGAFPARITGITWPLSPGTMTITAACDPLDITERSTP